ncbi:MAG: transposase [Terracidiphilus sp.]
MGCTRARWAVEEKRRIVELTLEAGASVARVAQAEGSSEAVPRSMRRDRHAH